MLRTWMSAVLGFFLAVVAIGMGGDAMIVARNVTVELKCTAPAGPILPAWFVNGTVVNTLGECYRSITNGRELTATLMIDCCHTCNPLNMVCKVFTEGQLLTMHNTTLTIQGHLPSPENIHINESVNSSTIEWKPPYTSMNNDIIRVDPHITQYTVYITDNYTGNIIVKENVTETHFTFNALENGCLCPTYQVSAWNAGGEGELSEPVQESIPQVENTTVKLSAGSDMLYIHIELNSICISQIPEFFLITLMTFNGGIVNKTIIPHQSGQAVADFTIHVPQIDMCALHVRISAGNSAGRYLLIEQVEVVCLGVSTVAPTIVNAPTTTTATVSTGGDATTTVDDHQQGDNTTLIVIISGVIAIICGALTVTATVGIVCYRVHRKENPKKCEFEMKPNQAYETVTRPQLPRQFHTEPCPAYGVVVQSCH